MYNPSDPVELYMNMMIDSISRYMDWRHIVMPSVRNQILAGAVSEYLTATKNIGDNDAKAFTDIIVRISSVAEKTIDAYVQKVREYRRDSREYRI